MDRQVDNVVAKDLILAEVIVEGKTETGCWTIDFHLLIRDQKPGVLDFIPTQLFQMQPLAFNDIGHIVKMP